MTKRKSILLFLLVFSLLMLIPFTSYAKQSGYFVRSNNNKYVEYHLKNGKKAGSLTVKKGKKSYKVINGKVTKINGRNEGTLVTKYGRTVYVKNGKTFNGIKSSKLYEYGIHSNYTGKKVVKDTKYYFKNGTLFTGIYKSKYYKKGVINKEFTGNVKYNKKTYFVKKGKLFNGFYSKRYYKDGKTDKTVNGYKTIDGLKYYFIKGVVSDPTIAHPLKILMVGNSYSYYNGYPQMLSKMISKTNKSAIVVRAICGGLDLNELMKSNKISYVAFKDGKIISEGSNSTLEKVVKIDFGNLNRAGKWDYIISQNNASKTDGITSGDIAFYNMIKKNIVSSKRYIIHGMYYSTSTGASRYNAHLDAVEKCQCSIINSNSYFAQYKSEFGRKWTEDLTIQDSSHHPSGRGGYLLALCIYTKLFGANRLARTETDSSFIKLYNSDGGVTEEFAPNKYKKGSKATDFSMSVTMSEAKKLQAYVRSHSDEYLGEPLYIQDYVL